AGRPEVCCHAPENRAQFINIRDIVEGVESANGDIEFLTQLKAAEIARDKLHPCNAGVTGPGLGQHRWTAVEADHLRNDFGQSYLGPPFAPAPRHWVAPATIRP